MFDLLIIDTVMFKSPVPGLRKKMAGAWVLAKLKGLNLELITSKLELNLALERMIKQL